MGLFKPTISGATILVPVNNAALLAALHDSKSSYCSFLDDDHACYHAICQGEVTAEAVAEARAKSSVPGPVVIRVMTNTHIPDADRTDKTARRGRSGKVRVPFPPFLHVEVAEDGEQRVVGKSHWEGGLHNGAFRADHGRITPALAAMMYSLVLRYSRKSNWRNYSWIDDMRSSALLQLADVALQFDEAKGSNPFAFITTVVGNVFKRYLATERRQRDIADEILMSMGADPSFSRQVAHEMAE